jgi:outer membrane protein OmpA-like peptidoglycan-associated protein
MELARAAEQQADHESAIQYYLAILEQNKSSNKVHYRLAENYRFLGQHEEAKKWYKGLIEEASKKYPLAAFYYAQCLRAQDSCQKAIPFFEQFRKAYRGEKDDRKYLRLAKFNLKGCQQLQEADSSLYIEALNELNTARVEGAPILLSSEELIYNRLPKNAPESIKVSDTVQVPKRSFYRAELESAKWIEAGKWEEMKFPKELEVVNGAFNVTNDRFYFTGCENEPPNLACDLFMIHKEVNGQWSTAKRLPPTVNTNDLETQPAVGIDEKGRETIYFVSDRKDGKGGKDLWYTSYDPEKGVFKQARNCGSRVNSVGDEITPFINKLNGKLYFSSNGHPGFGLFDVFKTIGQRSRWEEPINLGSALNSPQDEVYYILNPNGEGGIFASNRPHESKDALQACCDDLFRFQFNKQTFFPVQVESVAANGELIENPQLSIYLQNEQGELFFIRKEDPKANGTFHFPLEAGEQYLIKAQADGFLSSSQKIDLKEVDQKKVYQLAFELNEIKDKVYRIENIYYEFGKDELTEEAFTTIDTTILKVMQENPEIIVEIGSHTDSVGSSAFNQHLSQGRAQSVVNYLIGKGISRKRLKAKGYGESRPVAPNTKTNGEDNPEGRAQNRRTEFRVIGNIKLVDED